MSSSKSILKYTESMFNTKKFLYSSRNFYNIFSYYKESYFILYNHKNVMFALKIF